MLRKGQLAVIMQQYDIEWRYKHNNALADQAAINSAIESHLGYQKDLTATERYKIGKKEKLLIVSDLIYTITAVFIETFLISYFLKITNEKI